MGKILRASVGQVKNTVSLYFKLFILKILQNSLIGVHGIKIEFLYPFQIPYIPCKCLKFVVNIKNYNKNFKLV